MAKRNRHDRAFFNIHGHWPDETFDDDVEVEVEPSVEFRREMSDGTPKITMAQVLRMRPAKRMPRLPIWQQVCAFPAVAIGALICVGMCGALALFVYVIGAAFIAVITGPY